MKNIMEQKKVIYFQKFLVSYQTQLFAFLSLYKSTHCSLKKTRNIPLIPSPSPHPFRSTQQKWILHHFFHLSFFSSFYFLCFSWASMAKTSSTTLAKPPHNKTPMWSSNFAPPLSKLHQLATAPTLMALGWCPSD